MIDINNIKYEVILVMDNGKNMDITGIIENLDWEENKGELAMRINITMVNTQFEGTSISSIAKPGCLVAIIANWGEGDIEVARGTITDWSTSSSNSKESFSITCYDDLYNLQKSQDNIYYSAGASTKSVIEGILGNWEIPLATYEGPNETHAKLVYKSETLSKVLLDILKDAESKGASKCVIRGYKGSVSIFPKGNNKKIYHFGEDNTISTSNKQSTANLVTRVKVIGKEDEEGKSSVEAVLEGKTEFGIRQRIVINAKDENLEEAKKTAREILDEKGDIEKNISIEAPDVPVIRKGDLVHVTAGTVKGYYYVEGIRHSTSGFMSLDLEYAEQEEMQEDTDTSTSVNFEVGDTIVLNGAVYIDSYGNGQGQTLTNHVGTITIKTDTSRKCPYHVDGIGWVYPNTITKA